MTNAPHSPYGPAMSAAPPAQPAPLAPQQPLNLAQMHQPGQVPYGYTVVGPTAPNHKNGLGLAALIIGITAVVVSFLPLVSIVAFALGPVGVLVGVIGLVLADRPRRQAAWGTGLSAVSMGIAFVMIFVYAFGFLFAMSGSSY